MRRGVLCLLPALLICLLLSACDLRNRQSSEDFVPEGEYTDAGIPEANPGSNLPLPVQGETECVKIVLSESGEYIYTNPAISYSYELPFIDLSGSHAVGCNQEIEAGFGKAIRESLSRMEERQEPIVETVRCSSYIFGSVLTLRIERVDVDGSRSEAIYSLDRATGEKVTTEAFCAAAGLDRSQLKARLELAVEERLRVLAPSTDPEDPDFVRALAQTKSLLGDPDKLDYYLDSNGKLVCIAEIFTPGGGDGMEELHIN